MPLTLTEALKRLEGEPNVLRQDGWFCFNGLLYLVRVPNDKSWRLFILDYIPAKHKKWHRFPADVLQAYNLQYSLRQKMAIYRDGLPGMRTALKRRANYFAPEPTLQLAIPAKPEQQSISVRKEADYGYYIDEFPGGLEEVGQIKSEQNILTLIREMKAKGCPPYFIAKQLNVDQLLKRKGERWLEGDIDAVLEGDKDLRKRFNLPPPPSEDQKKGSG